MLNSAHRPLFDLKVGTARDSAPDTSTTASLITEDRKTRDHRPL